MKRPFAAAVICTALLLAGAIPAPVPGAESPDDRFFWSCRFSLPEFCAGENASATVNLTNQKNDTVAVQAVGIQLDWMTSHQHWYDEGMTGLVNISGGESLDFNMEFPIPSDAAPVDHVYHVCVEYFVNRSGKTLLETFCSENRSDFSVTDFHIAIEPGHRDIFVGEKAVFAISVVADNGLSRNVTLEEALPAAPQNKGLPPEIVPMTASAQNGSTMVLTTTNSTELGVYSVGIRASLRDTSRFGYVTLTVLGRPYFTVDVRPRAQSVDAGRTAMFMVSVRSFNNFTGNVTLSWMERPHGSTISFRPSVIEGNGTAEMTVKTSGDGQVGSFILVKLEAAGPGETLNATARLSIRPPPTELAAPDLLLLMLAVGLAVAAAWGILRRWKCAGG